MHLLERSALVFALIALVCASGCAKKIGATYDPFTIFPATAQWAWDESANRLPNDASMEALNIRTLVRETITEGLTGRGYTLAPEGESVDYRAHYQVGLGQVISRDSVQGYGSLSLTLVDVSTDRDVWVGFVKTEVDVSMTEAERRLRLQEQVSEMLKDFPPSQPK